MRKSECMSKGCPYLAKKTDRKTLEAKYVCKRTMTDISKVRDCG